MKEYIDQYMATRSYAKQSGDLIFDDDEGDGGQDDRATQQEFEDFQKWLEKAVPNPPTASEIVSADKASVASPPVLPKCGCTELPCILVGISLVPVECPTPQKS